MFEKVTRQISNRIDELEDSIKRGQRGGDFGGVGVDRRKPSSGGDDFGGGGGGFGGGLTPLVKQQSQQLNDVKKDIEDMKKLMVRLMKNPADRSQTSIEPKQTKQPDFPKTHRTPSYEPPVSYNPQPIPPPVMQPMPPAALYPTLPQSQPPPIGFVGGPAHRPGYITDTELDQGRGRGGRRRRRGKRGGAGSGYDSDNNSYYSEQVPMRQMSTPHHHPQQQQRPHSPGSVKSAPGGNKKNRRKNKQKPLTGSWEDIRAEMNI